MVWAAFTARRPGENRFDDRVADEQRVALSRRKQEHFECKVSRLLLDLLHDQRHALPCRDDTQVRAERLVLRNLVARARELADVCAGT